MGPKKYFKMKNKKPTAANRCTLKRKNERDLSAHGLYMFACWSIPLI